MGSRPTLGQSIFGQCGVCVCADSPAPDHPRRTPHRTVEADLGQTDFGQTGVCVCVCWPPKGGRPKISRFSPLLPNFRSFSLSLWELSREFLVVFGAPGPSNVLVWSCRPVVKPRLRWRGVRWREGPAEGGHVFHEKTSVRSTRNMHG